MASRERDGKKAWAWTLEFPFLSLTTASPCRLALRVLGKSCREIETVRISVGSFFGISAVQRGFQITLFQHFIMP